MSRFFNSEPPEAINYTASIRNPSEGSREGNGIAFANIRSETNLRATETREGFPVTQHADEEHMNRIFQVAAALSLLVLVGACAANRESISTQEVAPSALAAARMEAQHAVDPAARAGGQAMESERDQDAGGLRGAGEKQQGLNALSGREMRDEGRAEPIVAPLVPAFPQRKSGAHPAGLETVKFGFDSPELSQEAKRMLTAHGAWLRARPHVNLRLGGHADERGTSEYNLGLGWRRANMVRDFLIGEGVAPAALTSISFGEEVPFRRGSDESAWRLNRRVEFSLADGGRQVSSTRPPAQDSTARGG